MSYRIRYDPENWEHRRELALKFGALVDSWDSWYDLESNSPYRVVVNPIEDKALLKVTTPFLKLLIAYEGVAPWDATLPEQGCLSVGFEVESWQGGAQLFSRPVPLQGSTRFVMERLAREVTRVRSMTMAKMRQTHEPCISGH